MSQLLTKLKQVPAFENIPEDHLQWLIDHAQCRELQEGDFLFKKGDPVEFMHVIMDGEISVRFEQNGDYRIISRLQPGGISGALPYSRAKEASGDGVASKQSMVLSLHRDRFKDMEDVSHELTQALVSVMTTRVKEFAEIQQQNEKLISLGKLSAGLSHELNNPASALIRTSKEMALRIHAFPERLKELIESGIKPHDVDLLVKVLQQKLTQKDKKKMSMLALSEREEEIAGFMEDCGIEDEISAAEILAEYHFTPAELEELKDKVKDNTFGGVISWLENILQTQKLVEEIQDSSKRISDLVHSVKIYSHMDRGQEKELTDIGNGIKNTLTMLNHKLKKKNIVANINYDHELPQVKAHPGALNQVWTNLIDNAIDAMSDGGKLTISFDKNKDFLITSIHDNGSGIPEKEIGKIWDPFFTTKAIGEGSGLGLDIVQKIIHQHQGEVQVISKPGNTTFTICLPINHE